MALPYIFIYPFYFIFHTSRKSYENSVSPRRTENLLEEGHKSIAHKIVSQIRSKYVDLCNKEIMQTYLPICVYQLLIPQRERE
jgi:hypothetical protein